MDEELIKQADTLLRSRGFAPATPIKPGTRFYQDERGSAEIHPETGCVEIWEPLDRIGALLSPSATPPGMVPIEKVEEALAKTSQHILTTLIQKEPQAAMRLGSLIGLEMEAITAGKNHLARLSHPNEGGAES